MAEHICLDYSLFPVFSTHVHISVVNLDCENKVFSICDLAVLFSLGIKLFSLDRGSCTRTQGGIRESSSWRNK